MCARLLTGALLIFLEFPIAAQYWVTTAAGFLPDGMPALEAELRVTAVAPGADGNLYVAAGQRIIEVSPAGLVETVVGTGRARGGNEGPGTSVRVVSVSAMAYDAARRRLYFNEGGRVRIWDPAGEVRTVAGFGPVAPAEGVAAREAQLIEIRGLAVDAAGNLYLADWFRNRVWRVNSAGLLELVAGAGSAGFGGDGGPAREAQLSGPFAVAVHPDGSVFIADTGNQRIRRVTPQGMIETLATGVEAQSLVVTPGGALYYASPQCVCRLEPDGGRTPVMHQSALLPRVLAADGVGQVYYGAADAEGRQSVWLWSAGFQQRVAGGGDGGDFGPAWRAQLQGPWGVAVDARDQVFVADSGSRRLRRISPEGIIYSTRFAFPYQAVAVDAAGRAYVSQLTQLHRWDPGASFPVLVAGGGGSGIPQDAAEAVSSPLETAAAMAVSPAGVLHFAQRAQVFRVVGNRLERVAGTGATGYAGDGGPAREAVLGFVRGLAFDAAGNLYITDGQATRMVAAGTGVITTVGPAANYVAATADGNLFLALFGEVRYLDRSAGTVTRIAGGNGQGYTDDGPALEAKFGQIGGIALDSRGRVWLTDVGNAAVRVLIPDPLGGRRRR